jgi:hypothetical protein
MDLELEERYDPDAKQRKRGKMPSMLSSQYATLFQFCQARARAVTRIAEGGLESMTRGRSWPLTVLGSMGTHPARLRLCRSAETH